ncbi:hypothetical protein Cadr_000028431 [Camelus dromedarius]|uniref:Uncharacterized protein n=1 Tax=Camelus dromedarius TaxID=9838 RepID=A0A5N4CH54_CAMDR|nr:hypothetical protein Cadr_000028431 [Camelus dromedarius]
MLEGRRPDCPHSLTQLNVPSREVNCGVLEVGTYPRPSALPLHRPPVQAWLQAASNRDEAGDRVSWSDAGLELQ